MNKRTYYSITIEANRESKGPSREILRFDRMPTKQEVQEAATDRLVVRLLDHLDELKAGPVWFGGELQLGKISICEYEVYELPIDDSLQELVDFLGEEADIAQGSDMPEAAEKFRQSRLLLRRLEPTDPMDTAPRQVVPGCYTQIVSHFS